MRTTPSPRVARRAPGRPRVVFLVPVIARSLLARHAPAGAVLRRDLLLDRTLASVLHGADAGGDVEARVVVIGHDRPAGRLLDDGRVRFLRARFRPPAQPGRGAADKFRKRRQAAAWLRRHHPGPQLIMGLDADDLVGSSLFRILAERPDEVEGIALDAGYVFDVAERRLAVRSSGHVVASGSSFVGLFGPEDLPRRSTDRSSWFSRTLGGGTPHGALPEVFRAAGRSVMVVSEPTVAYLINHGGNLTDLRGSAPKGIRAGWPTFGPEESQVRLKDEFGVIPP